MSSEVVEMGCQDCECICLASCFDDECCRHVGVGTDGEQSGQLVALALRQMSDYLLMPLPIRSGDFEQKEADCLGLHGFSIDGVPDCHAVTAFRC